MAVIAVHKTTRHYSWSLFHNCLRVSVDHNPKNLGPRLRNSPLHQDTAYLSVIEIVHLCNWIYENIRNHCKNLLLHCNFLESNTRVGHSADQGTAVSYSPMREPSRDPVQEQLNPAHSWLQHKWIPSSARSFGLPSVP